MLCFIAYCGSRRGGIEVALAKSGMFQSVWMWLNTLRQFACSGSPRGLSMGFLLWVSARFHWRSTKETGRAWKNIEKHNSEIVTSCYIAVLTLTSLVWFAHGGQPYSAWHSIRCTLFCTHVYTHDSMQLSSVCCRSLNEVKKPLLQVLL